MVVTTLAATMNMIALKYVAEIVSLLFHNTYLRFINFNQIEYKYVLKVIFGCLTYKWTV